MATTMRRPARLRRPRFRRDGAAGERSALLRRFARQLRRYHTAAGFFTQEALAAKVGRGRLYLVQLEGAQREPSMVTLTRLARVLEVPVGALLE
jgi:transcriptional regulator with XRE-family HTH domain